MDNTKEAMDLIIELEYILAKECYSYTKLGGWKENYRQRARIVTKGYETALNQKITGHPLFDDLSFDDIKSIEYHFGIVEMHTGKALINILDFLEKRYTLNFSDLEKEYSKQKIDRN